MKERSYDTSEILIIPAQSNVSSSFPKNPFLDGAASGIHFQAI